MEFRVLGPLEVDDAGRRMELGGARQQALLAILLLHRDEIVPAEVLVEKLYAGKPPPSAAKSLQAHVSRLRKALGANAAVQTRGRGYMLTVRDGELDLDRFVELHARGRTALAEEDPSSAAALLHEALALWRGVPFGDLAYDAFVQAELSRLEELHLTCVEDRIDADLALGRHASVVGELERLVAEHPLRERLREQLMLALYRSHRQAEALEAYQQARRVLVEELGIDPGRALRDLEQAILRQDPALEHVAPLARPADVADEARASFVGRNAELAELVAGLDELAGGRGRLFLLAGEPGIGKSRLADELIRQASARGVRVLVGRCWEAGGAPAYWPWVQSLRSYIRELPPATLRTQLGTGAAELAQILPELRDLIPDLAETTPLDAEGARFRVFEATAEFLRNAAASEPLLLVLDDVHAADTPSLLLLQFLARELHSMRLLVVGSLRTVDPIPVPSLSAMLAEVAREPATRRLSLSGLTEDDVAKYVRLNAPQLASPEIVAALHEETEGNPLFVSETVRLLTREGLGKESADVIIAIPDSVREVIARRLSHLSESCNRLLVRASVLGREFGVRALAHAAEVSEDELFELLDEAMGERIVSDVPSTPGRLRFAHVLIRDTLYEGLTTARRVRLHRLTVDALESLYGDEPGPHLAELAHHSVAGSDFDKGLRYARRAGARALTLLAYEEAARLYQMALESLALADRPSEQTQCQLLLALGEAEIRAGNSRGSKSAFLDAAAIARRLGLAGELAQAAAGYGGRIMIARAGGDERLVPLLEEGIAALGEEDAELRVKLLARLAGALRDEPSRDRRDALSREALDLAREAGDPVVLAAALDGRVSVILAPDTVRECAALAGELVEVARQIGDGERMLQGHLDEFIARVMIGDMRESEAALDVITPIAEDLRQPVHIWQVRAARAMVALASGRLVEGEQLAIEAFAVGERAQPEMAIPVYRLQRYMLCDFRETLDELEPGIRELVDTYPARRAFRCVLAHLHVRLGRLPEAQRALDELAREEFAAMPFDQEWLYGMSLLAETCAALPDPDSAEVLYRLLLPWASFNATDHPEGMRGAVARYLGLLATAMERWEDAEQQFGAALALNGRMGLRTWLAHTQLDYARMLIARGSRDDDRVRMLLEQAGSIYREIGLHASAARAASLR